MPGDFFGDGGDLLVAGALGGKARDADFERAARFEHLVAREPVERREEAERLAAERRRPVGDERAGAVTRLQDANRRQRSQAGPHARTADPELHGQLTFRRQPIAGPQLAALDQAPHVLDDDFRRDAFGWFHDSQPSMRRGQTNGHLTPM